MTSSERVRKGRILWVVPDFLKGSGGHRTIFQNANFLTSHGYECDLYVIQNKNKTAKEIADNIDKWYDGFDGKIIIDLDKSDAYDIVIATSWVTVRLVSNIKCDRKVYFIQDYEPWFYQMGENYLGAEESYKYGLDGISIGHWLPVKLKRENNLNVKPFCFGADLNIYKKLNGVKKENAICFIFQPDKPRRCANMGLQALEGIRRIRPDIKVYLYGSKRANIEYKGMKQLGVLNVEECNILYNKCKVGLCLSASNPSRIPFEMMATGLPVVDLYLENNLYDFPDDGCLLAEPRPEAIAKAILRLLSDDALREKMSSKAEEYMRELDVKKGFNEFITIIDDMMKSGSSFRSVKIKKIYNRAPVLYSISERTENKKPSFSERMRYLLTGEQ